MSLPKLLFFIALAFPISKWTRSPGPCDTDIVQRVSQNTAGAYQLSLEARNGGGLYKAQLYNLYSGEIVETKQIQLVENSETVVFERIKPSLYTIYISSEACPKRKSVGGINGIRIGI
jgi:hypothetical protein